MSEMTCKGVECKVQGKSFVLRMNYHALALAESVTGVNFLGDVWAHLSASAVTALFWACAVGDQPKLTLAEVRSWGMQDEAAIIDCIRRAYRVSHGKPEDDPRPTDGPRRKVIPARARSQK